VELIHNFSLIHDDIEDASYERHHRPTVWRLWGQSQAINAGDAMFTLAYLALLKLKEKGIADEKVAGATKMLSLACLNLCEGQYLDVEYENRLDITIGDYLDMAAKKTAALLAVSTALGAYLGSEDIKLVGCYMGDDAEYAPELKVHVALKTKVPRDEPELESVVPIFEIAEPYEREIHELYGVHFAGHPRLIPLFLEREYEIPPFRKDFDTRQYVEDTFGSIPPVES
ncbi:MAG: polyprenyl synthetase family protein, partial [Planctomycetota bacterium]